MKAKLGVINGDVLTGLPQVNRVIRLLNNTTVTAIPEGDDYEFFGWNKPIFYKISKFLEALNFFSWFNTK